MYGVDELPPILHSLYLIGLSTRHCDERSKNSDLIRRIRLIGSISYAPLRKFIFPSRPLALAGPSGNGTSNYLTATLNGPAPRQRKY